MILPSASRPNGRISPVMRWKASCWKAFGRVSCPRKTFGGCSALRQNSKSTPSSKSTRCPSIRWLTSNTTGKPMIGSTCQRHIPETSTMHERFITSDPGGNPLIAGTHVTVEEVLKELAACGEVNKILTAHPEL